MSVEDHKVSFSLEVNVENASAEVRKLQTIFYRTLNLASRLTGDENLQRGIRTMQEAIRVANQLRLAYRALQLARLAAGDPIALGLAAVSVAEVVVSVYEVTGR